MDDLHPEALAATRHRLPDPAPADDPERLVGEVAPEHVRRMPRRPAALADLALAFDDPARDREQQRERDVGGRVGQHVGRVADRDPALSRGLEVDVVGADGEVGDRAHARRGVEQVAVNALRDGRQQRVRLLPALEQRLGRRRRALLPDVGFVLGAQAVERREGEIAAHENAWHGGG